MEYIQCDKSEATHVKITDEKHYDGLIKKDKIYEYIYDADPSEQTYYIICEDGSMFYDFEVVVTCEYLKVK